MDVVLDRRTNKLIIKSEGNILFIWNVAGLGCESNGQYRILSTDCFYDGEHKQIGNIFGDVNIKEKWQNEKIQIPLA